MQDLVSTRWIRLAALIASISVVWATFIPNGFPWMGLVWVGLALSAALWLRMGSTRSITQMLDDIEAEPVRVVATPAPVAQPVPKAAI